METCEEEMLTRDEMKSQLQTGNYEVHFIKADGSIRIMRCTLQESSLPPQPALLTEEGSEVQKRRMTTSMDTLPVWDLDENAWRSFRLDSIIRVERL